MSEPTGPAAGTDPGARAGEGAAVEAATRVTRDDRDPDSREGAHGRTHSDGRQDRAEQPHDDPRHDPREAGRPRDEDDMIDTGTSAATPELAPAPRAAAAATRVRAQAAFETGILLRNGEQLLVALVLPLFALVGLTLAPFPDLGDGLRRVDVVVPSTLALAVLSTAFTGQAIQTGFDRRYGVLRLLGVSPLGPRAMLGGKAVAVLLVEAIQVVVIGGVGLALGWRPDLLGVPAALVFLLVGTWVFVAIALLFAGTLRAEAVLALANLIWVLLLALGGVLLPPATLPAGWAEVARFLPSGALADGMRTALQTGGLDVVALLVLLAWGVLTTLAAGRLFRWSD